MSAAAQADTALPVEPPLIEIPATGPHGFPMGNGDGRADERPVHRVTLDAFAIGIWPVTNSQYGAFLIDSGRAPPTGWATPPFDHTDAPVCAPSWSDAVEYCDWLTRRTGRQHHLPTEAQREYAARGGANHRYPWGDAPLHLEGPFERGLAGPLVGSPLPVSTPDHPGPPPSPGPNGYGLYHMADLVHEWCADYYDRSYYDSSPTHNPPGPPAGDRRAARGGSWRHDIKYCGCAARSSLGPAKHFADFGFRVAASEGFSYV